MKKITFLSAVLYYILYNRFYKQENTRMVERIIEGKIPGIDEQNNRSCFSKKIFFIVLVTIIIALFFIFMHL